MHWTPKTQVFRGWRYDFQSFRQTPFNFQGATFLPSEIDTLVREHLLVPLWHEEKNCWTLGLRADLHGTDFEWMFPGDYLTLRTSPHSQDQWAVMDGEEFRDKYCHAQDPNEVPCACCS